MVAANYIVVMDGKENVKAGFTKECPAPSNMATEWAPVLTFMVDAVGSLDGFKFKVRVTPQGTNVFTDVYKRHLFRQPLSQCAGGDAQKSFKAIRNGTHKLQLAWR